MRIRQAWKVVFAEARYGLRRSHGWQRWERAVQAVRRQLRRAGLQQEAKQFLRHAAETEARHAERVKFRRIARVLNEAG